MSDWFTLASAPLDGRDIDILTASGFELRARYEGQGFLNEAGDDCGGWIASEEDKHPPSWTDGICWGSNEDGVPSDPPIMWRPHP